MVLAGFLSTNLLFALLFSTITNFGFPDYFCLSFQWKTEKIINIRLSAMCFQKSSTEQRVFQIPTPGKRYSKLHVSICFSDSKVLNFKKFSITVSIKKRTAESCFLHIYRLLKSFLVAIVEESNFAITLSGRATDSMKCFKGNEEIVSFLFILDYLIKTCGSILWAGIGVLST